MEANAEMKASDLASEVDDIDEMEVRVSFCQESAPGVLRHIKSGMMNFPMYWIGHVCSELPG